LLRQVRSSFRLWSGRIVRLLGQAGTRDLLVTVVLGQLVPAPALKGLTDGLRGEDGRPIVPHLPHDVPAQPPAQQHDDSHKWGGEGSKSSHDVHERFSCYWPERHRSPAAAAGETLNSEKP
jgi:hypothetical protein